MSEARTDTPRGRVGGMALANGLLVHGPTSWAVAVREHDGAVRITSGAKPRLRLGPVGDLPVLRGALRLAESLAVIPAARLGSPSARLVMEDRGVIAVMAGASALGAIARRRMRSLLGQELVGAAIGLVPSVALLSRSQAATWHAVEHKSIAAYEDRGAEGVASAHAYAKEHRRCGSNLVLPLLATTVAANTITRRTPLGRSVGGRAAITTLASGVAVEIFAFAERNPERRLARIVHASGHLLQARFVTREPGDEDLAVGRAALEELLRREALAAGAAA